MTSGLSIGRFRGITIRAHWSLLIIFWLISTNISVVVLPDAAPDHPTALYWLTGLVTAVAFMTSLFAHEVAHALVAQRHGQRVDSITLWLFGGMARLEGEPPSATVELRMAVAGPATSVVIGVLGVGSGLVVDAAGSALGGAALMLLGSVNLLLAAFNMLPGFPLDGGRVLRAWLWRRWNDERRATAVATAGGHVVSYLLLAAGFLSVISGSLVGLWYIALGWLLRGMADAEGTGAGVLRALAGVEVDDVMSPDPVIVRSSDTAADLIDRLMVGTAFSSFPVVDDGDRVIGLVSLRRLRLVPPDVRHATRLGSIMTPLDEVPIAHRHESMSRLVPQLSTAVDGRALVLDEHDDVIGIVSPTDVARALELAALRAA